VNYHGFREHIICDRKSSELMQEALESREYEFIFDISVYTRADVDILLKSINRTSLKKYIFCSSGAVYKPSNIATSESFEKGENLNWGNYGTDKKEAEDSIINSGLPYVIFRPTYIYGENNNLYRETYFFDRIKNNKAIPIPYGNDTKTQFIHIDDLVKIFESAMYNKNNCKIYNVTNPERVSWEELVKTCGAVMEREPIIKNIDTNEIKLEARSYFPFRDVTYILKIDELIKGGLYLPNISLKEGLGRAYKWYIEETSNIIYDFKMDRVDELI
jgi:nucleoside-diphosphate-sugar epimerase